MTIGTLVGHPFLCAANGKLILAERQSAPIVLARQDAADCSSADNLAECRTCPDRHCPILAPAGTFGSVEPADAPAAADRKTGTGHRGFFFAAGDVGHNVPELDPTDDWIVGVHVRDRWPVPYRDNETPAKR